MLPSQSCAACRDGEPLPFAFTMAFQPMVNIRTGSVWAYEALVRGPDGQSAASVLGQVNETNRYRFDQACRVKAIELASALFGGEADVRLSINFMPNAVYEPAACIRASLEAARKAQFPRERILFEFTENERHADLAHLKRILQEYRRQNFMTALDDFGAGYAGLNLLADMRTDMIKLDMDLIRGIDASPARRAIVGGVVGMARSLDVIVLAEGVETTGELDALATLGIDLFQGYLFAKPATAALPGLTMPALAAVPAERRVA